MKATPDTITSKENNPTVSVTPKKTLGEVKTKKKAVRASPKQNDECPIFLRKTYHMVDTCEPSVCSWSEDGETFVVKNTETFEKVVIPQFFKHNKFTSFVRQLNFYGFRKIKYCDTIKIDAKLEAETANFWRFRHENFVRGRPDLLMEIKRSNGKEESKQVEEEKPDVVDLKSEVTTLKERIASMSKNIDDLTCLVQNMAVKTEEEPLPSDSKKRKTHPAPQIQLHLQEQDVVMGDAMQDMDFHPGTIFPSSGTSRQQSVTSEISDQAFVEELFGDFEDDIGISDPLSAELDTQCCPQISPAPLEPEPIAQPVPITQPDPVTSSCDNNSPNPELMSKLSNALGLLPTNVQEMLVNRLVTAITNTDAIKSQINAVSACNVVNDDTPQVPQVEDSLPCTPMEHPIAVPLAAATLGALLVQYSTEMKKMNMTSLPVIPVHA